MKKFLWSLSIVSMLGLASCGSGSSKEAKELLSKMLQFVGIPQTIVANICQDANRDGICGGGELFTKVTINKGDSIDDIWRKISLTKDGRYFLQTYNPELPILVELQDVAKVNYDNGKFTLAFNGFKTKEDDNETKEVSILESMVDANVLTKTVADKFRTLSNSEAQDKYYTALLDSLEKNINTLRTNELDRATAMSATIKEMADETRANQEQADRINGCENNQTCVDEEIKKISDELIIDENEIMEIKAEQLGETSTTDNNTSNNQKQNFILPKGVMKDRVGEKNSKGETIPEFIDLKEMSVNVSDTNIRVEMTFTELPSELSYNTNSHIEENVTYVEYQWKILFDINNDDIATNGDLFFSILKATPYDAKRKSGAILNFTHQEIDLYTGSSLHFVENISLYTYINKNTMIFDIPKSLYKDLEKITAFTKVRFSAYYSDGNNSYSDGYPN